MSGWAMMILGGGSRHDGGFISSISDIMAQATNTLYIRLAVVPSIDLER